MRIHKGFQSLEALTHAMSMKGLPRDKYSIVRFLNQFYAIAFENWNKEIIAGSEEVFFRRDGWMVWCDFNSFALPYPIESRITKNLTDVIAGELMNVDPCVTIIRFGSPTATSYREVDLYEKPHFSCYLVWLGITFKHTFYGPRDLKKMNRYFKDKRTLVSFFRNKNALSINPFFQIIQLADSKYRRYKIDFSFDCVSIEIAPEPVDITKIPL